MPYSATKRKPTPSQLPASLHESYSFHQAGTDHSEPITPTLYEDLPAGIIKAGISAFRIHPSATLPSNKLPKNP